MTEMRRDRPRVSRNKEMVVLKAIAVVVPASFLPVFAYNLGGGDETLWHPLGLIIDVAKGNRTWPGGATAVLIGEVVAIAALVAGGFWLLKTTGRLEKIQEKRAEKRIDKYADSMTDPREVEQTNPAAAAEETRRLAPTISETHPGHGGIVVGNTVRSNRELRMPWEWVCIAIAGSRMGKSATLAIPAICYAVGFCWARPTSPTSTPTPCTCVNRWEGSGSSTWKV